MKNSKARNLDMQVSEETQMTFDYLNRTRKQLKTQKFHKTMMMPLMNNLKKKWFVNYFMKRFISLVPLKWTQGSGFRQEWQESPDVQEHSNRQGSPYLMSQTDMSYSCIQTIQLMVACICFWFVSIKIILKIEDFTYAFAIALIAVSVFNAIIQIFTIHLSLNHQQYTVGKSLKSYICQQLYIDTICFLMGLIYLASPHRYDFVEISMTVLTCIMLVLKINKSSKYFNDLLEQSYLSRYFKIINVIALMIFTAHLFSMVFNLIATKFQVNWLSKIGKYNEQWYIKYIYSMYWAITTMLTVGYGDIVPANEYQVAIVMVIEVLGSTLTGYLISTIGNTLSNLRKDAQKLQNDLSILKKTAKYFNISKDLTYRIRSCLLNNQIVESGFSVEDEKTLMESLNQELRRDIIYETNMKVLKKNVFFMSNFTKNFRSQIALRLVKKIYQPNQLLEVDANPQSLYIVDKGSVDIMVRLSYRNKSFQKVIRKINEDGSKQIRLNMYGLSGLLHKGKPLKTFARTKSFVFAYELNRKDFLEILQNNPADFEKFYELRDRLSLLRMPEAAEGQDLVAQNKHFCPRRMLILKKFTYSKKQPRSEQNCHARPLRGEKRLKKVYPPKKPRFIDDMEKEEYIMRSVVNIIDGNADDLISTTQHSIDTFKNYECYFIMCNPARVFDKYAIYNLKRCLKGQ